MDYEKYYDRRDNGHYLVHFPNIKGLSADEIENLFSAFGDVNSVDTRGQSHGLCFVRYKHLEDTIRCIKGLQNHVFIKILPHKNKLKPTNPKEKQYKQNKQTCDQNAINKSRGNYKNYPKNTGNSINYPKNKFNDDNESYQSASSVTKSFHIKDEPAFNNDSMDNEDLSDSDMCSCRTNTMIENRFAKANSSLKQQLKLEHSQKFASSCSISSEATNKSSKSFDKLINENEIPALVYKNKDTLMLYTKRIISAKEIIVANIHPTLGIHYILHLLEKYNPLSVSLMRTISGTGLRYCHVYFETAEAALATEKEFDKFLLHGNNLIVLTPQRLTKEAILI